MTLMDANTKPRRYASVSEVKAGGATYTPTHLAEFVARRILDAHDDTPTTEPLNILDPAVGDGELLLALLRGLPRGTSRHIHVFGFDTDADALDIARRRISHEFGNVQLSLINDDFLRVVGQSCAPQAQASLFQQDVLTRYDLVIANPPYVRTQIIGADEAQRLGTLFGLSGRVDLYHAFVAAIARVLKPTGTTGVIVSNRFMTTRGGGALRAILREAMTLRHVWDFGDTKLFDAAVLPAVIVANGSSARSASQPSLTTIYETREPATQVAATVFDALELNGAVKVEAGRTFRVEQGLLSAVSEATTVWTVSNEATSEWLSTVLKNQWATFGEIGHIRVGIKTTADSVFIPKDWSVAYVDGRPELLRPLTTHHVARRFRAKQAASQREVLYPHEVVNGVRRAVRLDEYPNSKAYLEAHREKLQAREYVISAGRQWYEIWVPQDPSAWSKTKLAFRDISEEPTFWLDTAGSVINGDCYWMIAKAGKSEDLLWLAAAVANSKFMTAFYDRVFNNKLYAGRRRFITQYVEQFPLPDPALEASIRLIAIAKQLHESDAPERCDSEIAELETLVWSAFGLSGEEV